MRTKVYSLIVLILLNSCATIIHKPYVGINIQSNTDSVRVFSNQNGSFWDYTPTQLKTIRSKDDISITAIKDTIQQTFSIKSRLSTAFWLGNLFSGAGVVGYAIDLFSPKRFTYPHYITINYNELEKSFSTRFDNWQTPEKRLLTFKISVPEGNYIYHNRGSDYGGTFGFLGISGGIEYYFTDKKCINADFGTLTDFMLPFPAPVDYMGSYNRSFAYYGDIQLGGDFRRFHYEYGIQINRTEYYERETVELFPEYIDTLKYSIQQNNVGISLSGYCRLSNWFNLGINYYPSFITWQNKRWTSQYSHLLFVELIFRIEALRPKKSK